MPRMLFSKLGYSVNTKEASELEGESITPSDATDLLSGACKGIYVTGSGNVNVQLAGGGTAVLTGLSAGQIVFVNVTRILSTSTTATGIYALYPAGNL